MRKLHLIFRNADGSRKTLIIHCCHQNLSPAIVHWAMSEIIALKLFVRNGVQLYTEIIGAKYVEKRITPLFDDFNPHQVAKRQMRQRPFQKSPQPLSAKEISPSLEAKLEPELRAELLAERKPELSLKKRAENSCGENQLAVKSSQQQAAEFATTVKASFLRLFFKKPLSLLWEQCCLLLPAANHRAASHQEAYLARGAP
ncbi:DUF2922 domain-containing protein [Enterococcus sp. LJL120]